MSQNTGNKASKESKVKTADTNRKYALLMHFILDTPSLLEPEELYDPEGNILYNDSPAMHYLKLSKVVPFWEEECPTEHREKWGARWSDIKKGLGELEYANRTTCERFNFRENKLTDVLDAARDGHWGACFDVPVSFVLLTGAKLMKSVESVTCEKRNVYSEPLSPLGY